MLEIQFFTKTFAAIDQSDLHELVEVKRVREHLQLDYKLKSYDHGREGTTEMLADVTAMANASGGYIIIGVEEDKDQDDGTPKQIVGISDGDKEANWIQGVCESSIDEKISGLRVQDIPLGNDKSCVVIYVPNSLRKPHMINYQRHYSFRMRNGRSKRFLDMREVRAMILDMNQYQNSLKDFLSERRNELKQTIGDQPWVLLMATPIYVDSDKIDPVGNNELRRLFTNPPKLVDPAYDGIRMSYTPKPRVYGLESAITPSGMAARPYQFLRLFRNCHFEYGECAETDTVEGRKYINPYRHTVVLIHFLDTMMQVIQTGQISDPLRITMYWCNIAESVLIPTNRRERDLYIWTKNELLIQATVNDLSDSHSIAHQLLDRLFNAFGRDSCPYFAQAGKFEIAK